MTAQPAQNAPTQQPARNAPGAQVDHLVVAAASLAQGVAWCEATLGVTPGPGGKHPLMGTHNRLFRIASAAHPDAYFEIIAIDPEAPPPGRARWFGLDDAALQHALRDEGPRLVHVVARCEDLDVRRAGLIAAGCRPGEPVAASRDTPHGRLQWRILVADDGRLDLGGALPTLIEWQGLHPAANMPASGVELRGLALRGLPGAARAALGLAGVGFPSDAGPALAATLSTPKGEITLESR